MLDRNLFTKAVQPGASLRDLGDAAEALTAQVEKGQKGDAAAFADYQWCLFDLGLSVDPRTEVNRRWLAQQAYAVEERFIAPETGHPLMDEASFHKHLEEEVARRSRVTHPLSQFIFSGNATLKHFQIFLEHQWFRTYRLYRDGNDLCMHLPDLSEAAVMYSYLYGEVGEENPEGAHSHLLRNLMKAAGLNASFEARPKLIEEVAYLNNRARCFRQPNLAWGFATFYVTELVIPANHERLFNAMQKVGLTREDAAYYGVHVQMVPARSKREWQLIARRLPDPEFQRTFLTSLRHFFEVERRYFDAIWAEMQAVK